MQLKEKGIINCRFLLYAAIIITFVYQNANAMTEQSMISPYLEGDYDTVIQEAKIKSEEDLNANDIYILFKAHDKVGDSELKRVTLDKLETRIPKELIDIIIFERILMLADSDNRDGFLKESAAYISRTENEYIIEMISKNIIGKYDLYKESPVLRQCLELLLPFIKSKDIKKKILKMYADTYDDSHPGKTDILILLWTLENAKDLSKEQKRIGQWVYERTNSYSKQVLEHFINQKKYRNYSYTAKNLPPYLKVLTDKKSESYKKLSDLYIYSMKRLRRYSQLISKFNKDEERKLLAITWENAMVEKFDLWLRKGNEKQAINTLLEITKRNPDYNPNFMYLALADFNSKKGNFKKSLGYHENIDLSKMNNEIVSRIKWKIWRIHYQLGDEKGLSKLAAWAEAYPFKNKEIAARFCYWSDKLKVKRHASSASCYQQYPLTYYGLHSKHILKTDTVAPITKEQKPSSPKIAVSMTRREIYGFITTLYRLGEWQIADTIVKKIIKKTKGEELVYLANILLSANRFYLVQLIVESEFRGHLEGSLTAQNMLLPYFYPKAYIEEIMDLKQKKTVPELLVLSVMREESHFNPEVESIAGAIGLMQLMPKTATYIGKLLNLKIKQDKLKNPKLNIRLGTTYLNRLLNRYKGNIFHTLAAYNGGPTNVRRWLKKNKSADNDDFVESITFNETKNYIRRVMRSYYIYQDLYGPQAL